MFFLVASRSPWLPELVSLGYVLGRAWLFIGVVRWRDCSFPKLLSGISYTFTIYLSIVAWELFAAPSLNLDLGIAEEFLYSRSYYLVVQQDNARGPKTHPLLFKPGNYYSYVSRLSCLMRGNLLTLRQVAVYAATDGIGITGSIIKFHKRPGRQRFFAQFDRVTMSRSVWWLHRCGRRQSCRVFYSQQIMGAEAVEGTARDTTCWTAPHWIYQWLGSHRIIQLWRIRHSRNRETKAVSVADTWQSGLWPANIVTLWSICHDHGSLSMSRDSASCCRVEEWCSYVLSAESWMKRSWWKQ